MGGLVAVYIWNMNITTYLVTFGSRVHVERGRDC